jgi:ribonuclease D
MPSMSERTQSPQPPPQWVRTSEELLALAARLRRVRVMGLDTESDSLHSFPEKVCLVQVALEDGTVFVVDPLVLRNLSPLAPVLADPGIVKVLHGASYDLSSLKRDFGFAFAPVFDTMIAGQFLGLQELGLASLLARFFGIATGPSRQKDDWGKRPLSLEQEHYAAQDVRHLIPLRERLLHELRARGREAWVEEECLALAATPPAERVFDPEEYVWLKGAKDLDRRGLAVLRELFVAREAWAREGGRPPFKVLGKDTLIHLAVQRPRTAETLREIPGCSLKVVQRYSHGILEAIARGEAVPEGELPVFPRAKKPRIPPPVQRRTAALIRWRTQAAERLGLDPGLILPRRLIERLAAEVPADLAALGRVEGIRRWRVETFGKEILEVLAAIPPAEHPHHPPRSLSGARPRQEKTRT